MIAEAILTLILSAQQLDTLNKVMRVAEKYSDYKTTIAAICFTESSLGAHVLGDDGKSLGIMQIQVQTVRFIAYNDESLFHFLKMSDKKIATILLKNDAVSIEIATKLFEYYRKKGGLFYAISKYNGGSKNHKYINKVYKNKNLLMKLCDNKKRRIDK